MMKNLSINEKNCLPSERFKLIGHRTLGKFFVTFLQLFIKPGKKFGLKVKKI